MSTGHYGQGGGNTVPTPASQIRELQAEIRKLWIRVNERSVDAPVPPSEAKWSYSGDVAPEEDVQGARWYVPCDLILIKMVLSLYATSTVPYSINTYIDNVYTGTTTFTAGQYAIEEAMQVPIARGVQMYPELENRSDGTGVSLGISYHWIPL